MSEEFWVSGERLLDEIKHGDKPMSKSEIKRIEAQERPDIENDELPTPFICDECGYDGNEDDLIEESVKGGMNYYCPQCQSPDISWKD